MPKKDSSSTPPIFSKETEQMVLGCMLSSEKYFRSTFEDSYFLESDFYYYEHKAIFNVLRALFTAGKPADLHLLGEELKKKGHLDKMGGLTYLADLAHMVGTSAYFEFYVQDLKSFSARRQFIARCEELSHKALSGKQDIVSLATWATEIFGEITKKTTTSKSRSLKEIAAGENGDTFLQQLKERRKKCSEKGASIIPGISTGYSFLDMNLGGLREENLILIAARPSVGKTAFALNLARNLGISQKIPVAFFSLEMTSAQIFLRLLSAQSGVPANKIERGLVNDSEMEQIETAIQQLEESKIFISDTFEISKIISQMRMLSSDQNVQAFFIDYIGLIAPSQERDIKAYEIGDITRSLKNFANEARRPVVCLAQLNRQADQNNKPQLSMLKDSGNLEQDADSVIFLHRKDLYDPEDKSSQIEVIIAKNRHGATDSKSCHFKKEIGVISEFQNASSDYSWNNI